MPAKQDIVKRLNFCIWTEGFARWLDMDVWDASAGDLTHAQMEKMLAGRECYAGLDLSSTQDLTALSLVFPDGEGGYDVLTYCWCPKEGIRRRSQVDRVPYDVWVREGYLTATEGRVVDYKAVRRRINELNEVYNIKDIAIDRWNATELAGELEDDGFDVVFFGQGFSSFTDPTKAVERALLAGNWRHGGHPVLRWSASNTMVEPGENEAVKPSKKRSREKIDPIVTGIMGTDRAIRHEGGGPSVYEERGLRYLDDDDDYEDEDEGGDQWEDDEDADLIDEDDE
jgi:phage terminase large subunit-like protein